MKTIDRRSNQQNKTQGVATYTNLHTVCYYQAKFGFGKTYDPTHVLYNGQALKIYDLQYGPRNCHIQQWRQQCQQNKALINGRQIDLEAYKNLIKDYICGIDMTEEDLWVAEIYESRLKFPNGIFCASNTHEGIGVGKGAPKQSPMSMHEHLMLSQVTTRNTGVLRTPRFWIKSEDNVGPEFWSVDEGENMHLTEIDYPCFLQQGFQDIDKSVSKLNDALLDIYGDADIYMTLSSFDVTNSEWEAKQLLPAERLAAYDSKLSLIVNTINDVRNIDNNAKLAVERIFNKAGM